MKINASTKSSAVYTHELIHEPVLSLEYESHIEHDAAIKQLKALDGLFIDMINCIS